jgi:hypothetical protein
VLLLLHLLLLHLLLQPEQRLAAAAGMPGH